MSDATVDELVEEAKAPGVFNIVSVLKEHALPKDTVNVYLEEQAAYDASIIGERIEEINKLDASSGFQLEKKLKDELESLTKNRESLVEKMAANKYVFTISGISEGKREELLNAAIKEFPIEYNETKNPITNEVTKTEIDSQERNDLFTEMLWAEHIEKITAPNGDVQENLTLKDVQEIRPALPIAAVGAITEAIEKLRIATAVFMMKVDEDFLAKS